MLSVGNILHFHHMHLKTSRVPMIYKRKFEWNLYGLFVCLWNCLCICDFISLFNLFSSQEPILIRRASRYKVGLHAPVVSCKPHDWKNLFRLASPPVISGKDGLVQMGNTNCLVSTFVVFSFQKCSLVLLNTLIHDYYVKLKLYFSRWVTLVRDIDSDNRTWTCKHRYAIA